MLEGRMLERGWMLPANPILRRSIRSHAVYTEHSHMDTADAVILASFAQPPPDGRVEVLEWELGGHLPEPLREVVREHGVRDLTLWSSQANLPAVPSFWWAADEVVVRGRLFLHEAAVTGTGLWRALSQPGLAGASHWTLKLALQNDADWVAAFDAAMASRLPGHRWWTVACHRRLRPDTGVIDCIDLNLSDCQYVDTVAPPSQVADRTHLDLSLRRVHGDRWRRWVVAMAVAARSTRLRGVVWWTACPAPASPTLQRLDWCIGEVVAAVALLADEHFALHAATVKIRFDDLFEYEHLHIELEQLVQALAAWVAARPRLAHVLLDFRSNYSNDGLGLVRTETYGVRLVKAVLRAQSGLTRLHVCVDPRVGPDFPVHLHRVAVRCPRVRVTWASATLAQNADELIRGTVGP